MPRLTIAVLAAASTIPYPVGVDTNKRISSIPTSMLALIEETTKIK